MRLAELPQSVLVQIVSGPQYSFLTLVLWRSGDRILQSKLESGVRSIDLLDQSQVPFSHWPSVLSRFQRLLHLSVVLENGYLASDASELQLALLSLSPVLESLAIISRDTLFGYEGHAELCAGSDRFEQLRHLTLRLIELQSWKNDNAFYKYITRNIWELSTRLLPLCPLDPTIPPVLTTSTGFDWPPHLETLDKLMTFSPSLESVLPASLTSLPCVRYFKRGIPLEYGRFRPTSLELMEWSPALAAECPVSVRTLKIRAYMTGFAVGEWARSLPPSLTELEVHIPTATQITDDAAASLPKSLTRLAGNLCTRDYGKHNLEIDLPNLSSFCTEDSKNESANFFRKLPPSLTYLTHDGKNENVALDILPPNLTELNLINMVATLKTPLLLPRLSKLSIGLASAQLAFLPQSLTHLSWNNARVYDEKLKALPNLVSLRVQSWQIHQFWALPASLTSLEISTALTGRTFPTDEHHFTELPPNLRVLALNNESFANSIIDSACFSSCAALVELRLGVQTDPGILDLLDTKLTKLRYLEVHKYLLTNRKWDVLPARFQELQNDNRAFAAIVTSRSARRKQD